MDRRVLWSLSRKRKRRGASEAERFGSASGKEKTMAKPNSVDAASLHPIAQRGDTVYLVGGKRADAFADAYAMKEDAEKAILGYIFDDEDEHWIGKLNAEQRCVLWTLKTNNTAFDVILNYYNSVAEDKWVLVEACLR